MSSLNMFLTNSVVNKNTKSKKKKLSHDQFHNILRLFNVLQNFLLSTSETVADYYL